MKTFKVWIGEYPYKEKRGFNEIYEMDSNEYIELLKKSSWEIGVKYLHLRALLNKVYIEIL